MALRILFILTTTIFLSGCQEPTSDAVDMSACQQPVPSAGDFDEVSLVNCNADEVWVVVVELNLSNSLEPIPWYNFDGTIPYPKWTPGEMRAIDYIAGYAYGDDIRLFVYARGWVAIEGQQKEKIVLYQLKDASHAELFNMAGLILLNSIAGIQTPQR